MNTPEVSLEIRIAQYVALRDTIKKIKDRHKEELKPYSSALESLGNLILGRLDAIGVESVRADTGTAYTSESKSATICDGSAFREYVISSEHYDLADWRANATAVADHIAKYGAPPPGVNFSVARTLGVRRG